jgi:hypothetical protein
MRLPDSLDLNLAPRMILLANSNEPARGPGNWLRLVRSAGRDASELDFKRVLELLRGRVNEFASSIKNEEEPIIWRTQSRLMWRLTDCT